MGQLWKMRLAESCRKTRAVMQNWTMRGAPEDEIGLSSENGLLNAARAKAADAVALFAEFDRR